MQISPEFGDHFKVRSVGKCSQTCFEYPSLGPGSLLFQVRHLFSAWDQAQWHRRYKAQVNFGTLLFLRSNRSKPGGKWVFHISTEGKYAELPNQEFKLNKLGHSFYKIQKPLLYYSTLNQLFFFFSNLLILPERLTVKSFAKTQKCFTARPWCYWIESEWCQKPMLQI